jgi:septal ring factor EnvC (AmiA/AmiB activator)
MLIPGCLGSSSAAADQSDLQAKTRELEQIKARIEQLRGQLSSVESERRQQNRVLRENEKKIGEITRHIRSMDQDLERQQRQLVKLEQERTSLNQQLAQHREVLKRQLRSAYMMGRQERLKILLNQQDPMVISRMLVYYDYLNASRFKQVEQLERSLEHLADIEHKITTEKNLLKQLVAEEEAEKLQLEVVRQKREQIVAALNLQFQDKAQQLADLQANEKQLQKLLHELQDALTDIPLEPTAENPFISRKGKLTWPAKGRIGARFGASRGVGKLHWDGVLIEAPEGEEVRSVHYGRVAFADWLRGFGLLLIIDHGDGYMSLYGYNQSLFKETGEWVEAGEVIAQVGSSGGRNTSGVYFGIRHNGEPIDPAKWCKKIKNRQISGVKCRPDETPRRLLLDSSTQFTVLSSFRNHQQAADVEFM